MTAPVPEVGLPAAPDRRRLVGIDVARGLALLAMMAVHVVPATTGGRLDPLHVAFGGRASALFAVLAGVSLALVAGRERPPVGPDRWADVRGLLARAGVVAFVGMTLGSISTSIAVILVNYAALFVVATAFLGLRARVLWPLAGAWLLLAPVASHLLRQHLPPGPGAVPSWLGLLDPVAFGTELLVTGYYPVLTWTGYLPARPRPRPQRVAAPGRGAARAARRRGGPRGRDRREGGVGGAALATCCAGPALGARRVPARPLARPGAAELDVRRLAHDELVVARGQRAALGHAAGPAHHRRLGRRRRLRLPADRPHRGRATTAAAAGGHRLDDADALLAARRRGVGAARGLADPAAGAVGVWITQCLLAVAFATLWHLAAHRLGVRPRGPLELVAGEAALAASGRSAGARPGSGTHQHP